MNPNAMSIDDLLKMLQQTGGPPAPPGGGDDQATIRARLGAGPAPQPQEPPLPPSLQAQQATPLAPVPPATPTPPGQAGGLQMQPPPAVPFFLKNAQGGYDPNPAVGTPSQPGLIQNPTVLGGPTPAPAAPQFPGSNLQMPQFQMPKLAAPSPLANLPPVPQMGDGSLMPGRTDDFLGAANAAANFARFRANPIGALGSDQARAVEAQAVAQAQAPFVQGAAQAEGAAQHLNAQRTENVARYGQQVSQQNVAQQTNQANQEKAVLDANTHLGGAMLGAQGQAAAGLLGAQGHMGAADLTAKAQHSPHVAYNQSVAALIAGMASGQIQPDAMKAGMEMLKSTLGAGAHPPGMAAPGQPAPAMAPGQAGGKTPDQVMEGITRANQVLNELAPHLGTGTVGRDFKMHPQLTEEHLNKVADQLAGSNLNDEQRAAVFKRIQGGALGDSVAVRNAAAQAALTNYLIAAPPPKDNQGNYPALLQPQFGGTPLFSAVQNRAPEGSLTAVGDRLRRGWAAQNTPYNTIDLGGGNRIPYSPPGVANQPLYGGYTPVQKSAADARLSQQAAMLRALIQQAGGK